VLVKKSSGKWHMCVDYTNITKSCSKDAYPLSIINKLVDNSSSYNLLSFMDAYLGYNQISMDKVDRNMTTFMTDGTNYMYNVLPFGMKNVDHMYQRMMNKVSKREHVGGIYG
jgi:hypothetical protein